MQGILRQMAGDLGLTDAELEEIVWKSPAPGPGPMDPVRRSPGLIHTADGWVRLPEPRTGDHRP